MEQSRKHRVLLADLTHTGSGISANTFPLGTAFVASYAQEVLGGTFDFQLHKFPQELSNSVFSDPPVVLALANYSWNLELSHKLAQYAKKQFPNIVVVVGGPNFPVFEATFCHRFLHRIRGRNWLRRITLKNGRVRFRRVRIESKRWSHQQLQLSD